jgi:hypothetical protein
MRWLIPVGLLLIVLGLGGAITAYVQSTRVDGPPGNVGASGGVPAESANASGIGPLILAPLAGLTLALGFGCIGIGVGRWNRPEPSYHRDANPWNEQPAEKGEPPTGLV